MELLFDGNESIMKLTARELHEIHRFNRFVVSVNLQSWFTSRFTVDAPINDVSLIQRLLQYDDANLCAKCMKMMERHSWYLSQELESVAVFSELLSSDEKMQPVLKMKSDRGSHMIQSLPHTVSDLVVSRSLFSTAGIDDSFLKSRWTLGRTLRLSRMQQSLHTTSLASMMLQNVVLLSYRCSMRPPRTKNRSSTCFRLLKDTAEISPCTTVMN